MRRFIGSDCEIQISRVAIACMRGIAHNSHPNLTGGMLFGCYPDLATVFVHGLAPITPDTCGTTSQVTLGCRGAREFFGDLAAAATDGELHYVGRWHSRNSVCVLPSEISVQSVLTDIRAPGSCKRPIQIVIGALNKIGVHAFHSEGFETLKERT